MVSSVTGKKYLSENPKPFTMTFMQGFYGTFFSFTLFSVFYEDNFINKSMQHILSSPDILFWVALSSMLQFIGTLTTNVSTTISSNSFVNTIKATDPFFAGLLSKIILNDTFSNRTIISIFIIVIGVIVACGTEFDFQLSGFLLTLIGLVCFPLRAVGTKKLSSQHAFDSQFLFWLMSITTMAWSGIFALILENENCLTCFFLTNTSALSISLVHTSMTHYLYNILAFYLIPRIPVLTFSIGNSIKRLITVYISIIYFRTPFTTMNLIAPLVVVLGVILYSGSEAHAQEKNLMKGIVRSEERV